MAKFMIFVLLVTAAVAVMAAPSPDEFEPFAAEEGFDVEAGEEDHLRFRRVTCDLLTAGGFVEDTACAANCLSMGKAGGKCNGGVCVCRKDKIKDLWDQRFG